MGLENDADMKASAEMTQSVHNEFQDVFTYIGFLKGTIHCRLRKGSNLTRYL